MRPNTVKQIWRDGKVAVGAWLAINSSLSAEIMAHQGYDWICIDTQHGAAEFDDAFAMLQAISTTDTIPIVRVGWNDPRLIMKYLDAGAYGIVVPMVNNRAEAERAVAACRLPPVGMRSSGAFRASMYGGSDYMTQANDEIICIVMVETAEGLSKVDEIAATPGVDVVYIGPSDLTLALGLSARGEPWDPTHQAAVDKIKEACERHSVIPGVHTWGPSYASRFIEQGFKMVMLTSDSGILGAGARSDLAELQRLQTTSTINA
jgi:4-hydroxy-2-oxoheptanedioate aldolase